MSTLETTDSRKPIDALSKGFINVNITLTSRGPGILMNPVYEEMLDEWAGITGKSASDKDIPLDIRAARKVIRANNNPNGDVGIPVFYIFSSLAYAGRFVKNGKKQVSTATSTTVYEFLTFDDFFFPFKNQEEPMVVDKRRGVANNGGKTAAVAIIRPLFRSWEITIKATIDTNIIHGETVKQLFEQAGRKAGLGDFRPMRKGPFGMFTITEWKILE